MKLYNAGSVFREFRGRQYIAVAWFCKRKQPIASYEELIANYHELDSTEREQAGQWINECLTQEEAAALRDYVWERYQAGVKTEEISVPIIGERLLLDKSSNHFSLLQAYQSGTIDAKALSAALYPEASNRGLGNPYSSTSKTSWGGFYRLSQEKDYSLPVSIWGCYRIVGEILEQALRGEETMPIDLRSRGGYVCVMADSPVPLQEWNWK